MQVRVTYKGDFSQVEAAPILQSLLSLVKAFEIAGERLNKYKDRKLTIYITGVGKGSFIVDLDLALSLLDKIRELFLNEEAAKTITTGVISGVLSNIIIKLIGNRKTHNIEERDNKVIINNQHGNIIILDKGILNLISRDKELDYAITEAIEPLIEIEQVDAIEIDAPDIKDKIQINGEPVSKITINREDMPKLLEPNPLLELSEIIKEEEYKNQALTVIKAVFSKSKRKWEFVYNGIKISAHIQDEDFYKDMFNLKYKFLPGTRMICDLKITKAFDEEAHEYINREYIIVKVHNVITPQEPSEESEESQQKKLF